MKAFVFLVLLTLSCAWDPSPTRPNCEGVPFFGPYASHFNTFVFGDFIGKNSDTEGRLFAGGNINIKSWAVGCRVFTESNCINFGSVTCGDIAAKGDLQDFLVSGKDLTVVDVEVKTGNIVHGGSYSGDRVTVVSDCSIIKRVTDFTAARSFLEDLSVQVAGLTSTGSVSSRFGTLTFSGTSHGTLEVFSVQGSDLAAANGIYFQTSVFINVVGSPTLTVGGFGFLNQFAHTHVLWNFPDTTQLSLSNIEWLGSILAPFADITNPTGVIWGQTFAKSWISTQTTTAQQNEYPFIGCLPTPPTPPSHDEICENVFGEASFFNTFVFENFECYNSDTEGRLAAGGNISVASYAIGCKIGVEDENVNCIQFGSVTCQDLGDQGIYANSVVAGQNFNSIDLEVKTGNVAYGGSYNPTRTTIVSDCQAHRSSPINFDQAEAFLLSTSDCLASQPSTGSVTLVGQEIRFKGTLADREIFQVSGSQFERVSSFVISNVKANATLIFNVNGVHLAIGQFDFPAFNFEHALFNFYEAQVLTLFNIGWKGSVLAPKAIINNPTGQISGQVFAKSWTSPRYGACMQQNDFKFKGCLPSCVPPVDPTEPTFDPTTVPPTESTTESTFDPTESTFDPTTAPPTESTTESTFDPTFEPTESTESTESTFDPTFEPTESTESTFDIPTTESTESTESTFEPTFDPTFDPTESTESTFDIPTTESTFEPTESTESTFDIPTTESTESTESTEPTEATEPTEPTSPPECEPTLDSQFCTYSQDEWGGECSVQDNSPACLLPSIVEECQDGIALGCSSGHTIRFDGAENIRQFLPQERVTRIRGLDQNYVNPLTTPAGDLASQLLALELSVRLDECQLSDNCFPKSELFICADSGSQRTVRPYNCAPFNGQTIGQFLGYANDILGGCETEHHPLLIRACLEDINMYFEGCSAVGSSFSYCPCDQTSC